MATVTRPSRPLTPAPIPQAAPPVPEVVVLDPSGPHYGDRIAFGVWVTCALFMAALMTYDTIMGLFR